MKMKLLFLIVFAALFSTVSSAQENFEMETSLKDSLINIASKNVSAKVKSLISQNKF